MGQNRARIVGCHVVQTLYIDKHVITVILSTASGEGNQSSSDSISPQKQAQQGTSREGMQITPTQGKLFLYCLFVYIVPVLTVVV